MKPTIGRIVLYTLGEQDASDINRMIAQRLHIRVVGNPAVCDQTFPMIITAVTSECFVSGQVFLDGNYTHWVERVGEGRGPTCWSWPPRV